MAVSPNTTVNKAKTKLKAQPKARVEDARPRARRTKVQQRADKMEQILDAAELLFSKHGLHGVTLKDVAQEIVDGFVLDAQDA